MITYLMALVRLRWNQTIQDTTKPLNSPVKPGNDPAAPVDSADEDLITVISSRHLVEQ
ncbi:MAG: hypothetical protein IBX69_13810 [Anaerolineales bacterium]|nr:hypothetical protein [Anaerolineales bacterium]